MFLSFLLSLLVTVSVFTTDLYLVSMPHLQDYFATSSFNVQLTLSTYLLGFSLSMLISAPLNQYFGYRKVLLSGLALYCIASLICILSPTIDTLIFGRFVQSFGAGFCSVLSRLVVRDKYENEERIKHFAYLFVGMAISIIIAPWLGSFLFLEFGWKANFFWMTIYSLFLFIAAYYTIPRKETKNFDIKIYRTILSDNTFITLTAAIALLWAGFLVFISKAPYIFSGALNSDYGFGIYYSFTVSGLILGTLTAKYFAKAGGVYKAISLGVLISFASGAVLFLMHTFMEGHSFIALTMFFYLFGLGIALPNTQQAISELFDSSYTGASFSLLYFFKFFLGAAGGLLVASSDLLFSIIFVCAFFALVLIRRCPVVLLQNNR